LRLSYETDYHLYINLHVGSPNNVDKGSLPRLLAVFVIISLLALLLAKSPISSFRPAAAAHASENVSLIENIVQTQFGFGKQEDNNSNRLSSSSATVTKGMNQELFQGGTNVNQDNDVIIGQCDGGHIQVNDEDEITQTSINSVEHGANIDIAAQELAQVATNVNIDNDLVIILDCQSSSVEINDNDNVIQTNLQSTNEEVNSDDNDNDSEDDNEEEEEEEADSE
jgi:hypothetical protein